MLQIIRHSLSRRWVQSLSTLTAVLVSVGIIFALYLLYLGVSLGLDAGNRRLGADLLVVPTDTIVEPETLLFTGEPYNVYMKKEFEAEIARIPGVRRTTPQFFAQTLDETCCSLTGATRLIGFDQGSDWLVLSWVKRLPGGGLAPDQVMVGAGVKGISGQTAVILKKKLRVAAVLEPTGTSLDYSVLMPIDATRNLVKSIPYFQVFLGDRQDAGGLISALLVDVDEQADKAKVVKAIERAGNVRVIQASVVLQRIKNQMNMLFLIMLGGGLLAAVSSVFQLFFPVLLAGLGPQGGVGVVSCPGSDAPGLKNSGRRRSPGFDSGRSCFRACSWVFPQLFDHWAAAEAKGIPVARPVLVRRPGRDPGDFGDLHASRHPRRPDPRHPGREDRSFLGDGP